MSVIERHTQYSLSKVDLRAVLLFLARRKFKTKKFIIKLCLIWLASMLAAVVSLALLHNHFTVYNSLQILLHAALLYLFIIVSLISLELLVVIPLKMRHIVKNSNFSYEPQTIWWNEYGIAILTAKLKRSYPLRLFYGWKDLTDYILLYLTEHQYSILPKRAFTDEQKQDLISTLDKTLARKL